MAICDGYKVYDVLARERESSDLILAHCWAHVRRKFVEAEAKRASPEDGWPRWQLYEHNSRSRSSTRSAPG